MRKFHPLMRVIMAVLVLSACQGGRYAETDTSASRDSSSNASSNPDQPEVVVDPLGDLLEPVGLGYRVDTIYGNGPNAVTRTAYGINALPVGVDVDGDSSTGNALGADISVHFFSLLLYASVTINTLDGAPSPMPLKVDVSIIDPRNLLGLPGLLGMVDPDLRIALGMDARDVSAPERFSQNLSVLDSIFEFLPRFTSANLVTEIEGGQGAVGATLAMYADRSGIRHDGFELTATTTPATSSEITVTLAPDAEESSVEIDVSTPTQMDIGVHTYDGGVDAPLGLRDVNVALTTVNGHFDLELLGVDGVSSLDDTDTVYRLSADQPIDSVVVTLRDQDDSGERGEAYVQLAPLPQSLELIRGANESISMQASEPIADLLFAQAENTNAILSDELDPQTPFHSHLIRLFEGEVDGRQVELLQARLGGLSQLEALLGNTTDISATLSPAPFELREDGPDGFQEATIEMLPGNFRLAFPDDERQMVLSYEGDSAGPGLHFREETLELTTHASVVPLPASISLCSASGELCGSHGAGTDTSMAFEASEPLTINYRQRSADGKEEMAIDDFYVQYLQVDVGIRSGGKRGYIFFDTNGHAFSGSLRQVDGDSGLAMQFSEGSFAEDRYVEYDDYILIEERSGSMRCPGRTDLEIRAEGVWFDADFILDQVCQ